MSNFRVYFTVNGFNQSTVVTAASPNDASTLVRRQYKDTSIRVNKVKFITKAIDVAT